MKKGERNCDYKKSIIQEVMTMYKILCVLALFMFESTWSYSNEKGPGQVPWPKGEVTIQIAKGEKQFIELSEDVGFVVEWLEADEEAQDADEFGIIQITDVWPSTPVLAPTVLIQLADVRPSGPMGVEEEGPNFMIQLADILPSNSMFGPGQK